MVYPGAGRADPTQASSRRPGAILGAFVDSRDGKARILRIVTLEDEETIHNAFFDRDFEDKTP
jgi:hypothetical protein